MRFLKAALPLCAVFMGGCSSLKTVSVTETDALIADITAPVQVPRKEIIAHWVQADNKKEKCLLKFGTDESNEKWWEGVESKILWDGSCRDGYAYGLGREFVDGQKGLKSSLVEYGEGGKYVEHYTYSHDEEELTYSSEDYTINVIYTFNHEDPEKSSVKQILVAADGKISIRDSSADQNSVNLRYYPTGYIIRLVQNENPNEEVKFAVEIYKNDVPVGYKILIYKNGQVRHVSTANGKSDYKLNQSFLNFIDAQFNEMRLGLEPVSEILSKAEIAQKRYKRKICGTDATLEGVSQSVYMKICHENGEAGDFLDVLGKTREEVTLRYANALAAKQEAAARIAAQNAANRNEGIQALTQQLNSISNSFQQNANTMYQYNMQNINNALQNSQPSWGASNKIRTNCIETANIISCRSQ